MIWQSMLKRLTFVGLLGVVGIASFSFPVLAQDTSDVEYPIELIFHELVDEDQDGILDLVEVLYLNTVVGEFDDLKALDVPDVADLILTQYQVGDVVLLHELVLSKDSVYDRVLDYVEQGQFGSLVKADREQSILYSEGALVEHIKAIDTLKGDRSYQMIGLKRHVFHVTADGVVALEDAVEPILPVDYDPSIHTTTIANTTVVNESTPSDTSVIVSSYDTIPFSVVYEVDLSLAEGVEVVKQEGVEGLKDDQGVIVRPVVDQLIAYGPRVVDEVYPHDVVQVIQTDTLLVGERVLQQDATDDIFRVVYLRDGNIYDAQVIQEGQPAIYLEGTGVGVTIPFDVVRQPSLDVALGEEVVVQEGIDGVMLNDAVYQAPVTEIRYFGVELVTESVQYQTIRDIDTSLKRGESKIITKGKQGVRTYLQDASGRRYEETIKVDPVDEVIHVGSKEDLVVPTTSVMSTTESVISSTESVVSSIEKVPQQSVSTTTVTESSVADQSEVVSEVTTTVSDTTSSSVTETSFSQPPIAIETSSDALGMTIKKETIPYETQTIEDANLAVGQRVITQRGVVGEKEIITYSDGRVETRVAKKAVNEVIRVGKATTSQSAQNNTVVTTTTQASAAAQNTVQTDTSVQSSENGGLFSQLLPETGDRAHSAIAYVGIMTLGVIGLTLAVRPFLKNESID